ncbi:hypothetical protein B0I35DRAFT_477067 [Stachybotrys elegans]|uniref:Zn(2)-C6 fungal-type domain-containing protein n=1 Tax=Stachybotrys elegans TaxID=80388 RepID=A0A8K0SW97_9HYPO|nr:hypothetical protein B0I35DRAFT_477067 [Stachybotrys elegans]
MSFNLRPLAPAPRSPPDDPDTDVPEPGSQPARKKLKTTAKFVCESCKRKKIACDARRPICTPCVKRSVPCTYPPLQEADHLQRRVDGLQQTLADHEELLQYLRTIPDHEAAQVLAQLRTAPNVPALLAAVKGRVPGIRRPSDLALARNHLPPSPSSLALELTARHQMAYPTLAPIRLIDIVLEPRLRMAGLGSPQLRASLAAGSIPGNVLQRRSDAPYAWWEFTAPLMRKVTPPPAQDAEVPPPGPAKPGEYIDQRLRHLTIDYWTRVPVSNDFAAAIISTYLQIELPIYGWFDPGLFIGSLVKCDLTFCSSFLVSAFMLTACIVHSPIDLRASALSHAFFKEAELLYRADRLENSLPNVVALHIFGYGCICYGRGAMVQQIHSESRRMAERMMLMGVSCEDVKANSRFRNMSPEIQRATAHTAWGIYNYWSLHSFYYEDTPIPYPPMFPIPGSSGEEDGLENPLGWTAQALAPYMGAAFPALCRLWLIAQEIAGVYHHHRGSPESNGVPLAFAEGKYRKLLEWTTTLDASFSRHEGTSQANVLMFHMSLHCVILALFRPFLTDGRKHERLRTFPTSHGSPLAACTASLDQLKRITLRCHLDYPGQLFSIVSMSAYLNLGSAMAGGEEGELTNAEERRFYFKLCMCAMQDVAIGHPMAIGLMEGVLGMAMKRQALEGSEARRFLDQLKKRGKHHGKLENTARNIMIDYNLSLVDVKGSTADSLGAELKNLVLMDEFTVGDE